ncbi:uncharacterized protein LOC125944756 [Dermacentor silvarum]|uniref:uncharacterized protein LOC125944756 n=1 Tax=Dermacentor silvarum TaxID=543639 RepID=UPI002101B4E4|nr:uncharacterized protein LOC125944756 [Dermacentor silvarum]
MDISSRDSVIVVATFCCVNNFVVFLVHVFPPEGTFNNREPGHMVYIIGVKTFESAVSVIVDIMTIIGVWDMDRRTTAPRKHAQGYRQKLIAHLKEPKRALLLFIIWSVTTAPASVGTDMVYNYHTSESREMFIMNAVIRCAIEAAKFYVLYRFYRLYNRLGAEQLPIVVEGATELTSPAVMALTAISGGSGTTGAEATESRTGAAHFRRRTPYGAGSVPRKSIMATDAASEDQNLRGQGSTSVTQRRHSYRAERRGTTSNLNDIGQDASAVTDGGGGGPKQDVEHQASYESACKAAPVRHGSRKQSYEFGGGTPSPARALGGKRALPERRSGRRLSIMSPTGTAQVANALQPVPEAEPLAHGNVSTASSSPPSPSARSILRNQQDRSPRRYQKQHHKTGEEEHVPECREDASHLATAEAAERTAGAERPQALRRQGRGGHRRMTSASPSASTGSTPSASPDMSAPATEGMTPHEESTMTTTTMTRREKGKSKRTSRHRSRSGDKSKTKPNSSKKPPHTSSKKNSPKMLSFTSSAESPMRSSADEFPNKQ